MGHFSCEIRDSRSLSSLNASLKEREVICQLPPYSFRFPQEQYTTGSDMNNPSNLWTKSYKVDFLVTRPKKLEYYPFIYRNKLRIQVIFEKLHILWLFNENILEFIWHIMRVSCKAGAKWDWKRIGRCFSKNQKLAHTSPG